MKKINISRKNLSIPYMIYMVCFVVAPLAVLLFYSFTDSDGKITFHNFINFFTDGNTLGTLLYSVVVALITTLVCLIIAYPVAFILAKGHIKNKTILLMIFIMPMWINFTLRITALKEILTFFEKNLAYFPFVNTIIGMTYDFLPFMILPIYTVLINIDDCYMEAGLDLGADKVQAFMKIILPMSKAGIISGVTMVFLPAMTNYVILDMLYNSTYIMGSLIGSYFSAYDWHNGSMISIILLTIIIIVTVLSTDSNHKEERL
ncbi:MAG: ABC transporter permease [Lachnospiraceae bacterium]|nr:ABC transporter permease [Lachnospiraceae bacterium]